MPVKNADKATLQGMIKSRVETCATVYTDDHRGYIGVDADYNHHTVVHSAREYVNGTHGTYQRH